MFRSHLDVVGGARDVVVAPLDEDDVLAPLPHHVVHRVPPAALVLDHHLKQHLMVRVATESCCQISQFGSHYWKIPSHDSQLESDYSPLTNAGLRL